MFPGTVVLPGFAGIDVDTAASAGGSPCSARVTAVRAAGRPCGPGPVTDPFVAAPAAARPALIMEVKRCPAPAPTCSPIARRPPSRPPTSERGPPAYRWSRAGGSGSAALLAEVVEATSLPVLVKDFVDSSRRQVAAAGAAGASAVPLTAAVPPRAQLAGLDEACVAEGLTPFVEITAEADCGTAPSRAVRRGGQQQGHPRPGAGAGADRAQPRPVGRAGPGPACAVSASGIDSPATAARLLDAGYDAVLWARPCCRPRTPGTGPGGWPGRSPSKGTSHHRLMVPHPLAGERQPAHDQPVVGAHDVHVADQALDRADHLAAGYHLAVGRDRPRGVEPSNARPAPR